MLRLYPGTDHITGLRAYAALFVLSIHTGLFRGYGAALEHFTDAGKHGVAMFFIISGFSVTASLANSATVAEYLVRRLCRIWPLYVCAIGSAFILHASGLIEYSGYMKQFGMDFDLYNFLMHISFLSVLDYRIANSVIGVEWSIPIEICWYFIMPLIISKCTRLWHLLAGVVLIMVLNEIFRRGLGHLLGDDAGYAAHWFPLRYGTFFLAGTIAYRLRQVGALSEWSAGSWVAVGALFGLFASMLLGGGELAVSAATFLIIVFYREGRLATDWLLKGRILLFLGTISYSIYLLHMLVIAVLTGPQGLAPHASGPLWSMTVLAATVAIATASYLLIEYPSNWGGKRLAKRVVGRQVIHGESGLRTERDGAARIPLHEAGEGG